MAIYLATMGLVALFGAILCREGDGKKTKLYVVLCFAALTVIAAIRATTVGIDTPQFCWAYSAIGLTPWGSLRSTFRFEWGFLVLCKLLNYISNDPQLLIAVSSAIINVPIGIFIYRNSPKPELSIFLYLGLTYYTQNMNIMRNAMAVAVVLLAFEALKERRNVIFFALIVLATGFHQTAPFLLIIWPLWRLGFNKKTLIIYCVLCAFLFVYATPASELLASLLGRDKIYNEQFTGSNYFGALFKALVALLITGVVFNYFRVGQKRGITLTQVDRFYCHMLMLWIMFSFIGMQIEIFSRLCVYFNIFAVAGVARALRFVSNKGERAFVELFFVVISLCYFVVIGLYRPEWQGAIPYEVGTSVLHLFNLG